MTENIIDTIKKIEEKPDGILMIPGISSDAHYGNGEAYFNNGLDMLLLEIKQKEELKAIPSFVGKYIEPIHLEILLGKYIVTSVNEKNKALTFLSKDFFTKIDKSVFLEINNGHLGLITPEEWKVLPEGTFTQLVKANKLQYISNESIEFLTKDLDLDSITALNKFSNETIDDKFKKVINTLNYFYKANKLEYLSEEAIKTINPEFIGKLPDNILQNENFLKNLTPEQAGNLNKQQVEVIKKNGKFGILPDNVLPIAAKKIEKQLNDLDPDILARIVKSKNEDIPIPDSKPRLNSFVTDVKFIGTLKTKEDLKAMIEEQIKEENWLNLRDNCFIQSESAEQRSSIYEILNEIVTEKYRAKNVYALSDKIQLLLVTIPLSSNEKELNDTYGEFKKTVDFLIEEPPRDIDEYFTKFDLYSSLLTNNGLDTEFREKIFKKQEELINNFIKEYFTDKGREFSDNFVKEKIIEMQLNHLALFVEKGVDLKEFQSELDRFSKNSNLTKKYRDCKNCLNEIKKYEPTLEGAMRQKVGDGIKILSKMAGLYFTAKAVLEGKDTAIKVVGGVGAATLAYKAFNTLDSVLQISDYSNPYIRKLIHEEGKNIKVGTDSLDEGWRGKVFGTKRSYTTKESRELSNEEEIEAKKTREKLIRKGIDKQLILLKTDEKEGKYEEALKLFNDKDDKNKSNQEKRREQLIKDDIEMRKKSLDLWKDKEISDLFKKYPQFRKEGIITRTINILKEGYHGFIEGVLDAINKYKGEAYKESVSEKMSKEEIAQRESSFRLFIEEISNINEKYAKGLTKIEHRKTQKMASINEEDKEKFEEFRKNARENKSYIYKRKIEEMLKLNLDENEYDSGTLGDSEIELTDEDIMGHSNYNDYPSQTNKSIFAQADENTKYLNSNEENDNHSHRKALEEQQQIEIPKSPYDNF